MYIYEYMVPGIVLCHGTCYWYLLLVPFILPMVGLEGIVNTSHPRHGFLIATVIRNEMKTEELGSQGGR